MAMFGHFFSKKSVQTWQCLDTYKSVREQCMDTFSVVRKGLSVHYPFHSSESAKLLKMVLEITKLIDNKSKRLFTGQVFEAFTTEIRFPPFFRRI